MNADNHIKRVLARIPYAQTLGVEPFFMGDEFTLILPFSKNNIGNPVLPALHGGGIGGFMEITAIAELLLITNDPTGAMPKPIGINIDYLRRGKADISYARAHVFKQGSHVANVRVQAWQESYEKPIAILHGHYLTAKTV